jgi:hypothetical protein
LAPDGALTVNTLGSGLVVAAPEATLSVAVFATRETVAAGERAGDFPGFQGDAQAAVTRASNPRILIAIRTRFDIVHLSSTLVYRHILITKPYFVKTA